MTHVVLALGSTLLFIYIVMRPFVLQSEYGLSPQSFVMVFAVNSLGLVLGAQVSAQLAHRRGPRSTLTVGVVSGVIGAVALTAVAILGAGLPGLLPLLFLTVSAVALVMPTSTALAITNHGSRAGTASGVIGLAQFGAGARSPPVSAAGGSTAVLMASAMALFAITALSAQLGPRAPIMHRCPTTSRVDPARPLAHRKPFC